MSAANGYMREGNGGEASQAAATFVPSASGPPAADGIAHAVAVPNGATLGWQISQAGLQQQGVMVVQAPMGTHVSAHSLGGAPLMLVAHHHALATAYPLSEPSSAEQQQYQAMVGVKRHSYSNARNGDAEGGAQGGSTGTHVDARAAQQQQQQQQQHSSHTPQPSPAAGNKEAPPAPSPSVSSRYHGVTWYKASKRWQARLCTGRRQFHLGYFKTEEEAARAYDRAMVQVQGVKAPQLNFPDEAAAVAASLASGTGPGVPAALANGTGTGTGTTSTGGAPAASGAARQGVSGNNNYNNNNGAMAAAPGSGSFGRRLQAAGGPAQQHLGLPGSEPNSGDTVGQLTSMATAGNFNNNNNSNNNDGALSAQRSSNGMDMMGNGDSGNRGAPSPPQQQLSLAQQQALYMQQYHAMQQQQQQQLGGRPPQRLRLQLQQLQHLPHDAHDEPSSTNLRNLAATGSGMDHNHHHQGGGVGSSEFGRPPLGMQQQLQLQSPVGRQPSSRVGSSGMFGLTLQQQVQQAGATAAAMGANNNNDPASGSMVSNTFANAANYNHHHSNEPPSHGSTVGTASAPLQVLTQGAQLLSPACHAPLDALAAVAAASYPGGTMEVVQQQQQQPMLVAPAPAVVYQAVHPVAPTASATTAPATNSNNNNNNHAGMVASGGAGAGAAGAPTGQGPLVQLVGRPAVAGILMADTGEFLPTGTTGALQLYEHEWDGSRLVLRNVLVGLVAPQGQQHQHQQLMGASLPLSEDTHMALSRGCPGPAPPPAAPHPPPQSAPELRGVAPSAVLAPSVAVQVHGVVMGEAGGWVAAAGAGASAMDVDQRCS